MAVFMLLTFASCKDGGTTDETTTAAAEDYTIVGNDETTDSIKEEISEVTDSFSSAHAETTTSAETTSITLPAEADPAKWTDEEIVAFYKAAAIKSKTKVKSTEYKNLTEMVVNDGDGVLGTLVEWATPFLVSALEDSQVEFDGITGGYEDLDASDAANIKAYKSGEYTVIEMTMKEQTDGIHADRYSGTVGHAISVVGDISSVEEALPMFKIGFEQADIKLRYSEPKVRVKINKDGIIEKGTWSYRINVTVANLRVDAVRLPIGATVDTAHGTVDYIITVGGGF